MGLQNLLGGSSIDLNPEFRKALGVMENSTESLFITGRAGTGKSTLLGYFRSITQKNVVVLAPTGVAALNVKGQTVHSFFGFRPDITPDTVRKVGGIRAQMYKRLDMVIIDEISMVRADLLDCVDRFLRLNGRDDSLVFGGVQMVLIGDLYQLPPVVSESEAAIFEGHYKSPFFFDAHCFPDFGFRFIELQKHYRQTDRRFIEFLNSVRDNSATEGSIGYINTRFDPFARPSDSGMYITLTTTNRLADQINAERLARLPDRTYNFNAAVLGDFDKRIMPTDERLTLKEGAQVMLLNNDTHGRWVNGSIGRIARIGGDDDGIAVEVELADGGEAEVLPHTWELFRHSLDEHSGRLVSRKIGSFTQYPIMLAWAVTIHKSQGKTFDRVIIDTGSGTFAHGQLYVALSRCTSMNGIILRKRVEKRHMIMDRRITEFLERAKTYRSA